MPDVRVAAETLAEAPRLHEVVLGGTPEVIFATHSTIAFAGQTIVGAAFPRVIVWVQEADLLQASATVYSNE